MIKSTDRRDACLMFFEWFKNPRKLIVLARLLHLEVIRIDSEMEKAGKVDEDTATGPSILPGASQWLHAFEQRQASDTPNPRSTSRRFSNHL